jgi:hypothetical protein
MISEETAPTPSVLPTGFEAVRQVILLKHRAICEPESPLASRYRTLAAVAGPATAGFPVRVITANSGGLPAGGYSASRSGTLLLMTNLKNSSGKSYDRWRTSIQAALPDPDSFRGVDHTTPHMSCPVEHCLVRPSS